MRVVSIAGTAAWPLCVARDRGIFAAHGLDDGTLQAGLRELGIAQDVTAAAYAESLE